VVESALDEEGHEAYVPSSFGSKEKLRTHRCTGRPQCCSDLRSLFKSRRDNIQEERPRSVQPLLARQNC